MKSLATDEVWQNITWKGTQSKSSLLGSLGMIRNIIVEICAETYKECTQEFFDSKLKTYLRHTEERIKRKSLRDLN